MKTRLREALLFAALVLSGCEMKSSNPEKPEPIKRITWQEALGLREFVIVSKKESCSYPYYQTLRTAYIKKGDYIYYTSAIPEEMWNDYFKDAQKGDTVRF